VQLLKVLYNNKNQQLKHKNQQLKHKSQFKENQCHLLAEVNPDQLLEAEEDDDCNQSLENLFRSLF